MLESWMHSAEFCRLGSNSFIFSRPCYL